MEFTTVEHAINRLQSAVIALMEAQSILEPLDSERDVRVEGLTEMLQSIDEDAWAISDAIGEW